MATHANALAVMAKAPVAGPGQNTLTVVFHGRRGGGVVPLPARGSVEATFRHWTQADFYLAFAPDDARLLMEKLAPPCFHLFPQQGDDLGGRMAAVFERLFQMGHKNIALIGGDLPPVPLGFFDQAYAFLESLKKRVVLGPSRDGGYYLVGCNQPTPEIFQAMTLEP